MGGYGSGRHHHWGTSDTTQAYRSIDARRWAKEGYLKRYQSFTWLWTCNGEEVAKISVRTEPGRVWLKYRSRSCGSEWADHEYPVQLSDSDCHFGGRRQWFLCPARGCGRRVAILYGGEIFACRNCHRLTYQSQREDYGDRAARRADSIRAKLGWTPGILNGSEYTKPKGMHWRTYHRLCRTHDKHVQISLGSVTARFGNDPLFLSVITGV